MAEGKSGIEYIEYTGTKDPIEQVAAAIREHNTLYAQHLEIEKLKLEEEKEKRKELRYIADRVQEYVEYAQHTVR